jgi:hypothetical protein
LPGFSKKYKDLNNFTDKFYRQLISAINLNLTSGAFNMVICRECKKNFSIKSVKIKNRDIYGRIKIACCPHCDAALGLETF